MMNYRKYQHKKTGYFIEIISSDISTVFYKYVGKRDTLSMTRIRFNEEFAPCPDPEKR
jgi:hypothetical protein